MVNGVRIERDREKERQREKEDPEMNVRRKERMIGKRDLSFYSSSFHRNPRNPKPVSNGPAFQETSSRTTCTSFIEIDDIRSAPHDFLRWMYELLFPLPLSLFLPSFNAGKRKTIIRYHKVVSWFHTPFWSVRQSYQFSWSCVIVSLYIRSISNITILWEMKRTDKFNRISWFLTSSLLNI